MKTFLGAMLLLSSFASADVITLSMINPPINTAGGYYVGPVLSNLGPVVCKDFDLTTYIPSSFSVSVSKPVTATEKLQAIIAFTLLSYVNSDYTAGSFQFALWNVKNEAFPDFGNSQFILDSYRMMDLSGVDFNFFNIYTPLDSVNQSFIGFSSYATGGSQVPEPASFIMIGMALVAIGIKKFV